MVPFPALLLGLRLPLFMQPATKKSVRLFTLVACAVVLCRKSNGQASDVYRQSSAADRIRSPPSNFHGRSSICWCMLPNLKTSGVNFACYLWSPKSYRFLCFSRCSFGHYFLLEYSNKLGHLYSCPYFDV